MKKQAFVCHGCGNYAAREAIEPGDQVSVILPKPPNVDTLRCHECDPDSPLDRYEFVIVDGAWVLREVEMATGGGGTNEPIPTE